MTSILAKFGVAALVALGAMSAVLPAASASELSAGVQQVRFDQRPSRSFCSRSLAESRARSMGLNRARVVSSNSRTVVVEGRDRRGRWQRVAFRNERGCPVSRRW